MGHKSEKQPRDKTEHYKVPGSSEMLNFPLLGRGYTAHLLHLEVLLGLNKCAGVLTVKYRDSEHGRHRNDFGKAEAIN